MKTHLSIMKTIFSILVTSLIFEGVHAAGFTDSNVTFYGEVRQVGGAQTVLLQSGELEMTFVNQGNPANVVTLSTELEPTGAGASKSFSYAIQVPLAFLPEAPRLGEFLAIGAQQTDFKIESITIDGKPATLPDGSSEYYGLSFASRAEEYRLDLLVAGDSTDTDGDGLPDWYEELHGLNPNLADAGEDFDGDGWSNLDEFRRGSDPALSNREPQLASAEMIVPEAGESGCYLQFHDSDTPSDGISIILNPSTVSGIQLRLDGAPVNSATPVSADAITAGRLTLLHADPLVREAALPLSWSDGGDEITGVVLVRVASPSTSDGNDAALWLDADSLPAVGDPVATWADRSGNSRDATQPLVEHQPLVESAGSHRSIRFQGPTSHLFFQDPAIPAGDHTILASYQTEGTPSEPQTLMSSNRGFLRIDPTAEAISYPGAPQYQVDGVAVRGFESTLQSSATAIFRREGSALQNIFGLSYNGESMTAESLDPVLPTLGARRLALPVERPIRDGFRGQLQELLVFPSALPEQKLRDVHDYLESKWGGAVIWDFSTELAAVAISATGPGRAIIRGGHGADQLRGGTTDNTISGGPGDDVLSGNGGLDRFVFGAVDTGRDVIVGFDLQTDVLDFSAHFWGRSGDARDYLSTRLDTNFSGPVPTLDTILILQRPDATVQEIVLRDTIMGEVELIQLIVEGRIRMGALSIPTDVGLSLAAGSGESSVIKEGTDGFFTVELTRSGDGLAGALDVPLGLFQDALGHEVLVDGSSSQEGQRAVVSFARGESTKRVSFRPVVDLEAEGVERWETSILPNFRYRVSGGSVTRSVSDEPMVTLAVIEANALVGSGQAARVRVTRDGLATDSLAVALELEGSAVEGIHINSVPRSISIPAGQASTDILITTISGWDGAKTRMAMLRLVAADGYLSGSPHEATIYVSDTEEEAGDAGFDRWLSAATSGLYASIHDLLLAEGAQRVGAYLRAYAFGDSSADEGAVGGLALRIVEGRPELRSKLKTGLPDIHWQVQDSTGASSWSDVSAQFSEEASEVGMRLLGPPIAAEDPTRLYRLSFGVETTSGMAAGVELLSGASQYAMSGSTSWRIDPEDGEVTSGDGGVNGVPQRLIVEVNAPTQLSFEMSIEGGNESDTFSFFVNGVQVAATNGDPVVVNQIVTPINKSILMWEFSGGIGKATISHNP